MVHGGNAFTITANTFHDITGTAIYTNGNSNLSNCHFDGNSFDRVFEPIHLEWAVGAGNCTVSHNVINHATRHAIELQGTPARARPSTATGSTTGSPTLTRKSERFAHGHQLRHRRERNNLRHQSVRVTHNYIGADGIPAGWNTPNGGWWDFTAIEAFGDGTVIDSNWIGPWGIGVMAGDNGPAGWTFTNNVLVGVHSPQTTENGGVNPATVEGNQILRRPPPIPAARPPPTPPVIGAPRNPTRDRQPGSVRPPDREIPPATAP